MNYSTLAFIADENIRAVSCVFSNGAQKAYTYKCADQSIKEGDLVVVENTASSSYFKFAIVKVVSIVLTLALLLIKIISGLYQK